MKEVFVMETKLLYNSVSITSDKILTLIKEKGCISFSELEHSLDDSYNLIFLAIDKLARENKIVLQRNRFDYLISTANRENHMA